jgi:hypothetical protein
MATVFDGVPAAVAFRYEGRRAAIHALASAAAERRG